MLQGSHFTPELRCLEGEREVEAANQWPGMAISAPIARPCADVRELRLSRRRVRRRSTVTSRQPPGPNARPNPVQRVKTKGPGAQAAPRRLSASCCSPPAQVCQGHPSIQPISDPRGARAHSEEGEQDILSNFPPQPALGFSTI